MTLIWNRFYINLFLKITFRTYNNNFLFLMNINFYMIIHYKPCAF